MRNSGQQLSLFSDVEVSRRYRPLRWMLDRWKAMTPAFIVSPVRLAPGQIELFEKKSEETV